MKDKDKEALKGLGFMLLFFTCLFSLFIVFGVIGHVLFKALGII